MRAKDKRTFADENSILIDDFLRNVEQFQAAGGHAVHFRNANQAERDIRRILADIE